jgi:hypothetical protein
MFWLAHVLRYQRDYGVVRSIRKFGRTYLFSRQRMHVTYVDWVEDAKQPLNLGGCEVRPARPDDPFGKAFPHLTPSVIARWLRPDHFFYVLLRAGTLAGYRCVSTEASPSVRRFFRLGPHQLFIVDHFIRPELRRLGLARLLKFAMARALVVRGFSEGFALEAPTNYDTIFSGPRRGTSRVGTLVRTCRLGRIRFELTPVRALSPELIVRQLSLLKQVAPGVSHVGVLFNPTVVTTAAGSEEAARILAARLGATFTFLPVRDAVDQVGAFEVAAATARKAGVEGLIVISDPMMRDCRRAIVRLVERLRVPAVYDAREFVIAGGLMFYGTEVPYLRDLKGLLSNLGFIKAGDWGQGREEPRLHLNRRAAAMLKRPAAQNSRALAQ